MIKIISYLIRTAIRHAQLLPNLPPIIFKRDNLRTERDHINHLLDTADKGAVKEDLININPPERQDLYDSDRTIILRKLSVNEKEIEEEEEKTDVNQLTIEQMQRRMKAFALTKRMKRVQEQRTAIYGLMAIEEEKEKTEHFSLNNQYEEDNKTS